jgi:hypothetical protein
VKISGTAQYSGRFDGGRGPAASRCDLKRSFAKGSSGNRFGASQERPNERRGRRRKRDAVLTGVSRKQISASLQRLGFREDGREFVHKNSKFSLDFVADTPYVDRRPIREFTTVRTAYGTYRTLTAEDAIADRVAGFIHWNDRQGLDVAERLVTALSRRLRPKRLFDAIDDIEVGDAASRERLEFARRRVRELLEVRK